MGQPHKHAELIKAWADGAKIEVQHAENGLWTIAPNPSWFADMVYRIKPEPKQDVVYEVDAAYSNYLSMVCNESERKVENANLRLTFDGETGKLKAAEVLG